MWEAPPTPHRLRRQKAKGTEVVMGVCGGWRAWGL